MGYKQKRHMQQSISNHKMDKTESKVIKIENQHQRTLQQSKIQFQQILNSIKNSHWQCCLQSSIRSYNLAFYKLDEIKIQDIRELYEKVFQRYQKNNQNRNHWLQHQLRIFIWLVAVSPCIFNIPYPQYGLNQIQKLSAPFFMIDQNLTEYQFKIIFSNNNNNFQWYLIEDQLLIQIVTKNTESHQWSHIAKQLFILSGKLFLRTAQACRERWQNHLDTKKIRGSWTDNQDYMIIRTVNKVGKRWSIVAKNFGYLRTEHMVKNRYKSIIKREARKKCIRGAEQNQICKQIQKKIFKRISQKQNLAKFQIKKQEYGSCFGAKVQELKIELFDFEPIFQQCHSHFVQNAGSEEDSNISQFLCIAKSEGSSCTCEYPLFLQDEDLYFQSKNKLELSQGGNL